MKCAISAHMRWIAAFLLVSVACSAPPPEAASQNEDELSIDTWCQGPLRHFGRCTMPTVSCASPLGAEIARATWQANHGAGTVPSHLLYGSRNVEFGSFVDAGEVFPEMAKRIAEAKSEVLIETFDWDPSVYSFEDPKWDRDPTTILLDGMRRLEKNRKAIGATEPVRVYLTFDGAHVHAPPMAGAPGVNKARSLFRQLASFGGFDARYVELHVGTHERWGAGGLHSKTLVVDGSIAMVMGANPQQWQTIGMNWHDSAYGVIGEAGVALARNIDDTWKESTEVLSCDVTKLDGTASCDTQPAKPIVRAPSTLNPALPNACLPVFVATKRAVGNSLTSLTLGDTSSPQDTAFLAIFQHAKNVIQIESPNMNARSAEEAFAAAKRGVNVRVLLTYTFNSASERMQVGPISGGGSNEDVIRSLHQRMKTERSACGKLDLRFISKDGVRPVPQVEPGASHVKFMTADGQVAMVGSANQDMSSWELTRETNIVVDDAKVTAEWNGRVFDADWKRSVSAVDFAKQILARSDSDVAADTNLQTILIDPKGWARDVAGACN